MAGDRESGRDRMNARLATEPESIPVDVVLFVGRFGWTADFDCILAVEVREWELRRGFQRMDDVGKHQDIGPRWWPRDGRS